MATVSLPARRDHDPAPPARIAITREELLDSYARPYRRWLPLVLKDHSVHILAGTTALLAAGWAAGELTGSLGVTVVLGPVSAVGAILTVITALYALAVGSILIRRRTAEWRPREGDLARARRRRPHAGEAAHDLAHDEYAVAVADDGRMVTFHYTPLMAGERPARDAILITGTPRYEAVEARTDRFDPDDAALAAEQLAQAQEHAAGLEAAAIVRARADVEEREAAHDQALEAHSTAEALRRITGQ